MAYVPVPKDLSKIKSKVAFNLTKRQLILFSVAFFTGIPLFFVLKTYTTATIASLGMITVILPCFLFAMYEKHGQPLEVVLKHIIQVKFIRPQKRIYMTENLYDILEKQRKINEEITKITGGKTNVKSKNRA